MRMIFLIFLLVWGQLQAADVGVEIEGLKQEVVLGDNIPITITLKYPKGFSPTLSELSRHLLSYYDPSSPPFRIVSTNVGTPAEASGVITQRIEYVLAPQRVGIFHPSFFKVAFINAKKKPIEVFTDPLTIEVREPSHTIQDPLALIAPPFPIGQPYELLGWEGPKDANTDIIAANKAIIESRAIPWVTLLACAVLLGVYWLIRSTKILERKPEVVPVDLEAERRAVLESLAEAEKGPPNAEEVTVIDHAMRSHFEAAYQIPAPHLTTKELLDNMEETHRFDEKTINNMFDLLHQVDKVKYSAPSVNAEDIKKLTAIARNIIIGIK